MDLGLLWSLTFDLRGVYMISYAFLCFFWEEFSTSELQIVSMRGALITNMDNEQVAAKLLALLPADTFDGVVFLDSNDRKMILVRTSEMAYGPFNSYLEAV